MTRRHAILGIVCMGLFDLAVWQGPALGETFLHAQVSGDEEIFIPADFVAAPGETGEIVIKAGDRFPQHARGDLIGLSFEIGWEAGRAEFLGASRDNTPFAGTDFSLEVEHVPTRSTAKVTLFTGATRGAAVRPGDPLARLIFHIGDNSQFGDALRFPISNAEIAFDAAAPRSQSLTLLQGGLLNIGNPHDPVLLPGITGEFYFEEGLIGKPGQERLIALRAADSFQLGGFAFDMEFLSSQLTFLGYETAGTALAGQGFEILTETGLPNHLGVLASTGQAAGAQVQPHDPILLLRFLVNPATPIGTRVPLTIRKMQMVDAPTLALKSASVDAGSLVVNTESALALTGASPLSSTSLRLSFSDRLVAATLADLRVSPPLFGPKTTLSVEGDSLTLRNLNTMIPGQRYRIDVAEAVSGNATGNLSSAHNFAFFRGFAADYPVSGFLLTAAEAVSDTELIVRFSAPVNPASIESADFKPLGLTVKAAVVETGDAQAVRLTTSSQKALTGSAWLTVNNSDKIHDPLSEDGELLSKNLIPFTPYHLTGAASPKLLGAVASKNDLLTLSFDQPLLGSSISLDAFRVYEQGKTANLISSSVFFDLSADHRTLTLRQVHTLAGRVYQLQIVPGKLRGNSPDGLLIDTTYNLASFLGQGSFFSPWDFAFEAAEAVDAGHVRLGFNEAVAPTTKADAFAIWTLDTAGQPRQLRVLGSAVDGAQVTLETEAQKQGQRYFVLADSAKTFSFYGEKLGLPDGQSFTGFAAGTMRAVSLAPREVEIGTATDITLTGVHFGEGVNLRLGSRFLDIISRSATAIVARVPADLPLDTYDIVAVAKDGSESRLPHAFTVIDPGLEARLRPAVLSSESYASPMRVPNDGHTPTTLWVRIADPRGVSDIDKVTADLRQLSRHASENFTLHEFVDDKAWYKLEITVPGTVPTALTPTVIPVTVQNKSGYKAFGTVEVLVSRDTETSIPPVIEKATAAPDKVVPGDDTEVRLQVEVSDADGAVNVARVVADASAVGLGILVLSPPAEIEKDRACERSDYAVGEWGRCVNKKQRRVVELKPNLECTENTAIIPPVERECSESVCTRSDWQAGSWGECQNGVQYREYVKKSDSTCFGEDEKPLSDRRTCTDSGSSGATAVPSTPTPTPTPTPAPSLSLRSLFDWLLPTANARTVFGNKIWYQSAPQKIPAWVAEGTYALPVTVIDREGTEVTGKITLTVARDSAGRPRIDDDDIFITPKDGVINDGISEFQVFVKATDPNGHDDIASVSLNLGEIGLPPVAMQKGQIEGAGAWYATPRLTIPRNIIPGFRMLEVTVTDKDGNSYDEEFRFHVVTPADSGKNPKIPVDRAYTNPRAFVAGGTAPGTLYVFVEEGDAPIAQVTANLGTILRYAPPPKPTPSPTPQFDAFGNLITPTPGATSSPMPPIFDGGYPLPPPISKAASWAVPQALAQPPLDLGQPLDLAPSPLPSANASAPAAGMPAPGPAFDQPTKSTGPAVPACVSTDTFACLTPAVAEGSRGRWYYLPDLKVREQVQPGQHPYFISVVATDTAGRRIEAEVPVFVSDGILPLTDFDLPYLVAAVATGRHEVQAFFSSPLDLKRIRTDAFKISLYEDAATLYPIKSLEARTDGRVVTLRTNPLMPGERFTLFADAEKLGLKEAQQTSNAVHFSGYDPDQAGMYFGIVSVRPLSANSVEVLFRKKLRFSSVMSDGSNFEIMEKGKSTPLPVRGVQITANGQGVILSTGTQRAGLSYLLVADNLLDYTGRKLEKARSIKLFDAFVNLEDVRKLLNQADFNQDGRVDFLDFSIFSTVYGTKGAEMPDARSSDLNGDGRIDFLDFTIFAQQYGAKIREEAEKSQPTPSPAPDFNYTIFHQLPDAALPFVAA